MFDQQAIIWPFYNSTYRQRLGGVAQDRDPPPLNRPVSSPPSASLTRRSLDACREAASSCNTLACKRRAFFTRHVCGARASSGETHLLKPTSFSPALWVICPQV